jgi:putative tricarboxylic transport membrane protein
MVLGPMLEIAFRQSLLYGDPFVFFKRPISAILLGISLLLLITPFLPKMSSRRKKLAEALEE